MARLLDRTSLQDVESSTSTSNNDGLPLIPNVHFSTAMAADGGMIVSQSQAASALQTEAQASTLDDSQTRPSDLAQMLSSLQNTGDLNALLQQQPNLLQELSTIAAAGEVSSNPEPLSFQYEGDSNPEPPTTRSLPGSSKPVVYREQDRFLPIHNVARIMRNAIPKSGKVSKEAKECIQECVSEFISFITSEASDRCLQEKRKTITGDDILFAMATLGFDNHIDPLRIYLQKYREHTKTDKAGSPPLSSSNDINPVPEVTRTMSLDELSVSSMPPLSASHPLGVSVSNVSAMIQAAMTDTSLENMSTTHLQ
ncbi:uncharacterized protein LOC135346062 [Halichondria panicea]|uniref:uncharacterized protein LOC135346062 n=1 Tax=Halichondria panicea TaxID=6063 RepID=UPI00312B7063